MPIDKTKAKEKLKGKMRAFAGYQQYSKDMKVDPRTTKADAIADIHAEARYQKGEPDPMSEEQRQQQQANRESYSKGDKIRGIGNVHQFKKTKRKKGEIVPPPVPVPR